MQKINVNWGGIFANAYTYSSNYLLLSLMIIIASIIWVWIYEKPQFYKNRLFWKTQNGIKHWYKAEKKSKLVQLRLIFKKSKHSNILSPIQSNVELDNVINNLENENTNTVLQKRLAEISRNTLLSENETPDIEK